MSDTYRDAVFTPAELHRTISEFQGRIWQLEAEVERLRRIEHAARRFYTFGHGGYRWEATDERRDALYDALRARE